MVIHIVWMIIFLITLIKKFGIFSAHIVGPVCVKVDKIMDAHCGAREICTSVPFLLYNCTGLSLGIVDDDLHRKGHPHFIPSCFSLVGDDDPLSESHGISALTSGREMKTNQLHLINTSFLPSEKGDSPKGTCVDLKKSIFNGSRFNLPSSSENITVNENDGMVKPFIYSPPGHISENSLVVRLQKCSLRQNVNVIWNNTWSSPFSLVPESGSTCVAIPQPGRSSAFLVSVTSSQVPGDLGIMSRAVIFQPRYDSIFIYNLISVNLSFIMTLFTTYQLSPILAVDLFFLLISIYHSPIPI